MCYPKPGPRCSHHANERLKKALIRLETVEADYNEALEKLNALHQNETGYTATEEQLPKRTVNRVKVARTRVLSCHRMLDATPEGKQDLEKTYGQTLTEVNELINELKDYEKRENLTTDDEKQNDEHWTLLNEERMSAFSIYNRLKNRHAKAVEYREFCLTEYTREQQRIRLFKELQKHAEKGDIKKYAAAQDKLKKLNEKRVDAPIAELFYRSLPAFSQEESTFPLSQGLEERSTHALELSQGGKVSVENVSMILKADEGYSVHHVSEIVFHNEPKGDERTRRGYGSSLKNKKASFTVKGKTYATVEEAQEDLEKNRLKNSYFLTNRAVYSLLAQIDGARLKELHKEVQENYPEYKARKEALLNKSALEK